MIRILFFVFLFSTLGISGQIEEGKKSSFVIRIDDNVKNANDKNEKEIIKLWKSYLTSGEYKNPKSAYWDTSQYKVSDYFLWPVDIKTLRNRKPLVQCTILGAFPVAFDHYALKTSLAHIDKEGTIVLEAILSVYAKKVNDKYVLVNSSQYHKNIWQRKQVGAINYYVHPNHSFNIEIAKKMNDFNHKLSNLFRMAPISFDYFVSTYSREIVRLWGYDYMSKIYIPGQTGGVADISNNIVYAGNNSEYYPHELVHLYTKKAFPDSYHFWLNEGFATFMAGSGGHNLDWHIEKLKEYVSANPDFEISFKTLKGYIPNGLHSTEFRYVIGGLICKIIFEKNGMNNVLKGLNTVNTDEDLYKYIEENLKVKRKDFSNYIKDKLLQ